MTRRQSDCAVGGKFTNHFPVSLHPIRVTLSCADASPVGVSPVGPSSLLTRQLQDSWRNLRRVSGASPAPTGRRLADSLLFEVTDASVVQDSSSKYVVSSDDRLSTSSLRTSCGA